MKLLPLLDRTGKVKYWADPRSSWMTDLDGNAVALIAVNAVYDKTGFQLDGGTATTSEIEMARWCYSSSTVSDRMTDDRHASAQE
jgi:hypothetical protein